MFELFFVVVVVVIVCIVAVVVFGVIYSIIPEQQQKISVLCSRIESIKARSLSRKTHRVIVKPQPSYRHRLPPTIMHETSNSRYGNQRIS